MGRIFCCSDMHGCIDEFEYALSLVLGYLDEPDTKLVLLGDYIHGGTENYAVLDRVISLQREYGSDKVIALMGNHEEAVIMGFSTINEMIGEDYSEKDEKYMNWLSHLPLYYQEGNTIFVHAGIDEEAGEDWEWGTGEHIFTGKFPHETGFFSAGQKIVAGHVHTSEIAEDKRFNDIYYDGQSHYYIDGDALGSGNIPVLMVDTDNDTYYTVTENGFYVVLPYGEE